MKHRQLSQKGNTARSAEREKERERQRETKRERCKERALGYHYKAQGRASVRSTWGCVCVHVLERERKRERERQCVQD